MLRKLLLLLPILCVAMALPAYATSVCPALTGADSTYYAAATAAGTNCNTLITINSDGSLTFAYPNLNPYDGVEDNYVGVVNNLSSIVNSISLTGNSSIFGFDGDGIDAYGLAGNALDSSGYGGPAAYFTGINPAATVGTVNFIGGLAANGGTGYFSLEEAPGGGNSIRGVVTGVTPEPSSLLLLGTGLCSMAGMLRRRIQRA